MTSSIDDAFATSHLITGVIHANICIGGGGGDMRASSGRGGRIEAGMPKLNLVCVSKGSGGGGVTFEFYTNSCV